MFAEITEMIYNRVCKLQLVHIKTQAYKRYVRVPGISFKILLLKPISKLIRSDYLSVEPGVVVF